MNIVTELEKLRLEHYDCEDSWYSCPKFGFDWETGIYQPNESKICTCGADEHNKALDNIIKFFEERTKP